MAKFSLALGALIVVSSSSLAFAADCIEKSHLPNQSAAVAKDGGAAPLETPKGATGVHQTEQGTTQNFDEAKREAESKRDRTAKNEEQQGGQATGKPCP